MFPFSLGISIKNVFATSHSRVADVDDDVDDYMSGLLV